MSSKSQPQVAPLVDRRIAPSFMLFGAAALIWLAGIGAAKAATEAAARTQAPAEAANPAASSLSQLLTLHRQAAASSGAVVIPRAAGPCCAHVATAK